MIKDFQIFETKLLHKFTDKETNKILNDCSYFFKNWKGEMLYRSFKSNNKFKLKKIKAYKKRNPTDVSKRLHDKLNFVFQNLYGWKVRNGTFCTQNKNVANGFNGFNGKTYIFLPIGKYEYLYSHKIVDLYVDIYEDDLYNFIHDPNIRKIYNFNYEIDRLSVEDLTELFKYLDYDDKGIPPYSAEISFNINEYYLLDTQYEEEIEKLFLILNN